MSTLKYKSNVPTAPENVEYTTGIRRQQHKDRAQSSASYATGSRKKLS